MLKVLLGLGSNRDFCGLTPPELLSKACRSLEPLLSFPVFSSVYKTRAMYYENQQDFYNMVAKGFVPDETSPFDFLEKIHEIENQYGRDRSKEIRFGPRPLDIDIEIFGSKRIKTKTLQIPHVRMKERAFVLVPALEILTESADIKEREKYSRCLKKIEKKGGLDGIQKIWSAKELLSLSGGENAENIK